MGKLDKRSALEKDGFLSSVRQCWFAILLLFALIILFCDTYVGLADVNSYLNFLTVTGSIFILGESATSFAKTQSASSIRRIERRGEIQQMKIREQRLASQKEREEQRQSLQEDPIDPTL